MVFLCRRENNVLQKKKSAELWGRSDFFILSGCVQRCGWAQLGSRGWKWAASSAAWVAGFAGGLSTTKNLFYSPFLIEGGRREWALRCRRVSCNERFSVGTCSDYFYLNTETKCLAVFHHDFYVDAVITRTWIAKNAARVCVVLNKRSLILHLCTAAWK